MTPRPLAVFSFEEAVPGLMGYIWLLLGVVVVIVVGLTYATSTTHTRKLSKTEKVVFELLWVSVPLAALIAVSVSKSFRVGGAVLLVGFIAVALGFLQLKRKR